MASMVDDGEEENEEEDAVSSAASTSSDASHTRPRTQAILPGMVDVDLVRCSCARMEEDGVMQQVSPSVPIHTVLHVL